MASASSSGRLLFSSSSSRRLLTPSSPARLASNSAVNVGSSENGNGNGSKRYQISYDSIRPTNSGESSNLRTNPYLKETELETITKNVKNVQGWRGGAERGFSAIYPDVIQTLAKEGTIKWDNNEMGMWFTKVLTHNLSKNVVGNRFGILVPICYRHIKKDASKEEMNLAHILGWGVELIRASNTLTNEIMGLRRGSDQPWWEKHNIDQTTAFNDALLLQNGYHILLQNYFYKDPNYNFYMDAFTFAIRSITMGRMLQFKRHPLRKPNYDGYTYEVYKFLVRHNLSSINYILPISLAMHLAGMNESQVQEKARNIFELLGYFARMNRDYANHYLESENSDIREGKITWLNVLARQRLDLEDRKALDDLYGHDDDKCVEAVKALYCKVNMRKSVMMQIDSTGNDIKNSIQQISRIDASGFSPEFVFNIIESMERNHIV